MQQPEEREQAGHLAAGADLAADVRGAKRLSPVDSGNTWIITD
jgi:hypothetical protein